MPMEGDDTRGRDGGRSIEGRSISQETDFAALAEDLVVFAQDDEDHLDLGPAKRLYQALLGTPLADRLSLAIAELLTDARWRVQEFAAQFLLALFFLSGNRQPTATVAHARMLGIIGDRPSLLAFGPTCTLRSALIYLIDRGEARALEIAFRHADLAGEHVAKAIASRNTE